MFSRILLTMDTRAREIAGRSALICHADEPLNRFGLARWLASFTDLVALVVIHEPPSRFKQRVKREIKRVGRLRFLDVIAFRLWYRLFHASRDRRWEDALLRDLERRFPELPAETKILDVTSPNAPEVARLLEQTKPDFMVARCKNILKENIFGVPRKGTYVMHPGVCPEYRNAHGCFWALANRDVEKVGMTLLRVDPGVDTGPVLGYYSYPYDEASESHTVIQSRVVFDNLDALKQKFLDVLVDRWTPVDTMGRPSRAWGQPWLTSYLRWKRAARRGVSA